MLVSLLISFAVQNWILHPAIADGSLMDPKFEHVLNSIAPKKPRSCLEPYRELIREMRKRKCSYREIAQVLQDHFALRVAASTVNTFVMTRLNTKNRLKRNRQASSGTDRNHKESLDPFRQSKIVQETLRYAEDIKPALSKSERPGPFHYDEEEPLRIIRKSETPPTTSPRK